MTNANLNAALSTPDDDVAVPIRTQPGSFLGRIKGMEVGSIISHIERPDATLPLATLVEQGTKDRDRIRSKISSAIRAAGQAVPGATYETEITTVITAGGKVYFLAIITRVA